jgi:predicted nucleic acid-binding protein
MIVADASVLVESLTGSAVAQDLLDDEQIQVPTVTDVEVASTLRKYVLHIRLSAVHAYSSVGSSQSLPVPPMSSLRGCGSVPAACWSNR